MAAALWVIGGLWLVVYFGTWILQIGLWLLELAVRLTFVVGRLLIGLTCILALAVFDRPGLRQAIAQSTPLASPRPAR